MWSDHREFAADWIDAINSRDLARVMSHYEDDVVLTSPRVRLILGRDDGVIRGKAALRDYIASALARIPDLNFTLDRVFSGINSIVIEFHTTDGRHGAELLEFSASGRVSRVAAHYAL